jgi:hypothetical protein
MRSLRERPARVAGMVTVVSICLRLRLRLRVALI